MAVPYSAYPQADADWLYGALSLPRDNIYTAADRTEYRLKDPMKSDEGRYKVTIRNKHGEGEAFINLEVIGELSEPEPRLVTESGHKTARGLMNAYKPQDSASHLLLRCPGTREEPAGGRHRGRRGQPRMGGA